MRHSSERSPAGQGGANINSRRRHFNAALLGVAVVVSACGGKGEPSPVDKVLIKLGVKPPPDAGPPDAGPPPPPPPPVSTAPDALLVDIPAPPAFLSLSLGDASQTLRERRPNAKVSELTPRVLTEALPDESPFAYATYLLTRDGRDVVETIALTLRPEYTHPGHWDAMVKQINARLGAGKAFDEAPYAGLRWVAVGHRIDLRRDKGLGDEAELVFDLRGGREVEMP